MPYLLLLLLFMPVSRAVFAQTQFSGGHHHPYLNVCADTPYGQLPPKSDITAALQWAIDNQRMGNGFKPYIPAGHWDFKGVRIPPVRGGSIEGMGPGDSTDANAGLLTTLRYVGPSDQPAIKYQGQRWTIDNIGIVGRRHWDKGERPAVGILSTTIFKRGDPHGQRIGTTGLHMRRVVIQGFETCFQNGEHFHTNNSDMHILEDCRFKDCEIGLWNKHQMGMGLVIDRLDAQNDCRIALRYDAGGDLTLRDTQIGGRGKDRRLLVTSGRVGEASGSFVLDNVKVDGSMNGKNNFQLIEMTKPGATDFICTNVRFSNPDYTKNGGKLATLMGDATLTLRDSYRPPPIECKSAPYGPNQRLMRPHVLVDNCRLVDGKMEVAGPCSLVVQNCLEWDRVPTGPRLNLQRVPDVVE